MTIGKKGILIKRRQSFLSDHNVRFQGSYESMLSAPCLNNAPLKERRCGKCPETIGCPNDILMN